jgi:hypothetical protein
MEDRTTLLARLLAVHMVLLGAAAVSAARAEDAAPNTASVSTSNGKRSSSSESDATNAGSVKAISNEHLGDKVDGSTGERHAGSKDAAKGREETESKGMRHGEDHAGAKHNGTESNPIETRITVFGKPQTGSVLNALDRKKTKTVLPSAISNHHRPLIQTNKDQLVRNSIGQPIHQLKTDGAGVNKKGLEAISTVEGAAGSVSAVKNSGVGIAVSDPRHQGFVPLPARDGKLHELPLNTALNHSIINGRSIGRPGLRTGVIGGATKNVAGVLNGTDIRPRHP